jgi:peptide chain release factor subunit 1
MLRTYQSKIETLESISGTGTELVTLTVPPDTTLASVRSRIAREHADAENIKSDQTRTRVQQALDRLQRLLQQYTGPPANGLILYAGVVDGDLFSAVFDDLPNPVPASIYRCDDHFDVTPLRDATMAGETFGLVVVERGRAAVGRLVGDNVQVVRTVESQVMGDTRAGGQSAQRFQRERQRQKHEFFTEVAATAADAFLGDDPVSGVAVGGTHGTAKTFVADEYLDHRLQDAVLGTYAVEYATEQGLHQLVEKAAQELLDATQRETRALLDEFYERLREGDTVAYGRDDVEQAATWGAVDTALLADTLSQDRHDEIETAVSQQGGEVYVVPTTVERGTQFADAFGGVGALLRYPVN